MRILTLSTLFPAASRPNFGIFVERQTAALTSVREFAVTVINPVGIAPWPISLFGEQAALRGLPHREQWGELDVYRPRFTAFPKIGGRFNPDMIAREVLPLAKKLHAEIGFDIVAAEFFYPDGPAAMKIAEALGIPFTIKARGADIHHWGQQSGCARQMLQAAEKASGLLAVSGALKADMVALGMDVDKIMVHYTGLDQSRFALRDRSVEKAKLGVIGPLILSVGALIPRKGQDLLIAALPMLPEATLMLAGHGESESEYRALADQLGVADRACFLGSVPHDDLPALFAAADVMALVSSSEGLANAWVEALACGTPIVASDVGGIRELVKTPEAGRIVARNSVAVALAIKDVLASPPSCEAVAANVGAFSWKENAQQLAAFFRTVAASSGSSS